MNKRDEFVKCKKAQANSSMVFFWERIKDLSIPMPRTTIIEADRFKFSNYLDKGKINSRILNKIRKIIKEEYSYPIFIRTDATSGKHSWSKSCYIEKEENLEANILYLIELNEMADFMGLPYKALLIREYIPMATGFTAFNGKMPVNPERRYFVKDGKVICHHPYWPEDAIIKGGVEPSIYNWKQILKRMNTETTEEIKLLTKHAELISKTILGHWSIDFCKGNDGAWYLIDMADHYCSWHPKCNKKA